MSRTLAIGDIHGGLKALKQLLERAQLNKKDVLIFMGDYVDGWSESAQVLTFLMNLSRHHHCVFLKGNHDIWCEDWLRTGNIFDIWYDHGGKETIASYKDLTNAEIKEHLSFFQAMKPYYIDTENRLFIHAGFTSMHGVKKESNRQNFYFDRTLWEMALAMNEDMKKSSVLYPKRLQHYSEIFIGHTPTLNFNSYQPMHAQNVWNIDTGAAFYGKLSAINVITKAVYQSDVVQTLYPDEKGRNK